MTNPKEIIYCAAMVFGGNLYEPPEYCENEASPDSDIEHCAWHTRPEPDGDGLERERYNSRYW